MSNHADKESLLAEVLAEASPADFRAVLLATTLREARRCRRWRQAREAGGVLSALLLTSWLVWQHRPERISAAHPATKAGAAASSSFQLVETRSWPAGAVVITGNFPAIKTIFTAAAVTQITTTGGGFHYLNDEQLLALLGDRPAVLIRTGPHSEDLVFANPEDQKRLFGN